MIERVAHSSAIHAFLLPFTRPAEPLAKGDVVLFADASWMLPPWRAVRHAKAAGARVGPLFYDLFPVSHPEWFTPSLIHRFGHWLPKMLEAADFFVADSEAVRTEASALAPRLPGLSFPLGCDLDGHAALSSPPPANSPTFLIVGTLEPRKNHAYALDAFEPFWTNDTPTSSTPTLAIVGKPGWLCEPILHRIRNHPQFNRHLTLTHTATDAHLNTLFAHARGLIMPSLAEGFGLPIVEALRRQRTVLASDIPIHHEAAGPFAAYFNLADPTTLTTLISALLKTGHLPNVRPPTEFTWPTWREATAILLGRLKEQAAATGGKR